ncbi:MAG: response regulator [Anaerolineaceae bacterium]|jgi:ATP-dependent Lon protease|nr:MAG: response regulator [Anaerolineaceae bacterium]
MANKPRLLIVDDDPLNTQTLSEIFSLKGHDVDVAHSGLDALEEARNKQYNCVLSDIKMERMNGVELLCALKSIQPGTPFILMTAYSDDDLIIQGIRNGALIALIKPLDIDRLLGHIAHILQSSRLS